ncbi:MAG TPA: glycine betaine ABC transporter substrate-binding protein [Chthoniobacterales bacterium]|nr:glycine betaine ABC transporter substrate-binding protein [Chthoniobacterales bacterium]
MRLLLTSFGLVVACAASAEPLVIGSKRFTESYVLAEIAKRSLEDRGLTVEHRQGMGGTIILWEALRTGAIHIYPEYTGTIAEEILKERAISPEAMRNELAKADVGISQELGFNNTYALVMRRDVAQRLGLRTISDLQAHPQLRFGLTHEFLSRRDGWPPLAARYGLAPPDIKGIDHALGYEALRTSSIDVKDAYSTDAKIAQNDLVTLADDRNFFPQYKAVFLYRTSINPEAIAALQALDGTIPEERMIRLNAEAEQTKDYARAAALYFGRDGARGESFMHKLARWTARHLQLAGVSLLLAVLVGVPLGIVASRRGPIAHAILAFTGVVQTIPSLALLALLVPLPFFGISARTAIAALFLYGLLPIVRNTATGLQDIAPAIRESAIALGLSARAQLLQVYLPIASRTILAGIKTSAVINVGTATLAALIGAGGLGEPIISGLNLNDHRTILQGAIPAALLALLVQWGFDLLDRLLIPRGLRI